MKTAAQHLTTEKFVSFVVQSSLLSEDEILATVDGDRFESLSSEELGDLLIAKGKLTEWQNEKLQRGKWRGFCLGKYKILKPLGQGGMGKIYLGQHSTLGQKVAIKVLTRRVALHDTGLTRFLREATAAAQLNHANVVRTFDVDNRGSTHYMVMEYLEGQDVFHLVKSQGPLDFRQAAHFVQQAASGLAYAHRNGVVHRDIKPANLFIVESDVVKILDFGLARVEDDGDAALTAASDKTLGTADFIAPEQAMNSHEVDGRADIYSLGHSLYFMLTGRPPFPTGRPMQRIMKHCTSQPQAITETRPDTPPDLMRIWKKMTRKRAENRYQDGDELVADLDEWLNPTVASVSAVEAQSTAAVEAPVDSSVGLSSESQDVLDVDFEFDAAQSDDAEARTSSLEYQGNSDALDSFDVLDGPLPNLPGAGVSPSATNYSTVPSLPQPTVTAKRKTQSDKLANEEPSDALLVIVSICLGVGLGIVIVAVAISYAYSFFTEPVPQKSFESAPTSLTAPR